MPGAVLLVFLLGAVIGLDRAPVALAIGYGVMGGLSFLAYGADKRFAAEGRGRISEATLLALDLCLGIVGGLLGQAIFRHKTQKQTFILRTMLILTAHIAVLAVLASGRIGG